MSAFIDSIESATLNVGSTNLSDAIDAIITQLGTESNMSIIDSNAGNSVLFQPAAPSHGNAPLINLRHDGAGNILVGLDPDGNWTSAGDTSTAPSPSSANAKEISWAFPIADQIILFSTAEDSFWMCNTSNTKTRTPDFIGAGVVWEKQDPDWPDKGYGIVAGELEMSISQGLWNSGASSTYGKTEVYFSDNWYTIYSIVTTSNALNAAYDAGNFRVANVPLELKGFPSGSSNFFFGHLRMMKVVPYDLRAPARTSFNLKDATTGANKISIVVLDDDGADTHVGMLWQYGVAAG